ncbi:MAG: hypothetical protein L6416_03740 [Candidatus Omnitrophica bacterium]|nr:hypothetical protein [Candidatus Omnitrophota bacterium]
MKKILILIIILGLTVPAFAKAYFAEKEEMIVNADIIAIVDITDVKNLEKDKSHGNQEATVSTIKNIKGTADKQFKFFVPCFFPCAITSVEKGQYLVFLKKGKNGLEGCNWHFSYRPIKDNKAEWYKKDTDFKKGSSVFEMKELEKVINEITEILKNK